MVGKAAKFVKYGLIGDKMLYDEYVAPFLQHAWEGDQAIFDLYISPFLHHAWEGDKALFAIADDWVQSHRLHLLSRWHHHHAEKDESESMVDVLPYIKDDLK